MGLDKAELERLRAEFPYGTRVELERMDDPQAPPRGTRGTVLCVDDIGSLGMSWDNGSHLSVLYEIDRVRKLPEEEKPGGAV